MTGQNEKERFGLDSPFMDNYIWIRKKHILRIFVEVIFIGEENFLKIKHILRIFVRSRLVHGLNCRFLDSRP